MSAGDRGSNWLDLLGLTASGACLVHCLLLPVLLALLPALSSLLAVPEEAHLAALCFAVPATAFAMLRGWRLHGIAQPLLVGAAGLAALVIGALAGLEWLAETGFTVAGSLLVMAAHLHNWRLRAQGG